MKWAFWDRMGSKASVEHGPHDLAKINRAFVSQIKSNMSYTHAMEEAIGGQFEKFGKIELSLLHFFGLRPEDYLIDIGCGSGRLAIPLSKVHNGKYLGTDLVPELINYARNNVHNRHWRFSVVDHIDIPEAACEADMICFFSVMTHLLHEQSYWYLEEAKRVLKPGGRIIFSFLEFNDPNHWEIFGWSIKEAKSRGRAPLNVFIERDAIEVWARALGLTIECIHSGSEQLVPEGPLGQAICVLHKPMNF